jgi:hypothetical protein
VTFVSAPQAAPAQPVPVRVQLTPLPEGSFCTMALKPVDCEDCTEAVGGFTETETGGGGVVMVMIAAADFVPSEIEVAVKVTVLGVGAVAGAV